MRYTYILIFLTIVITLIGCKPEQELGTIRKISQVHTNGTDTFSHTIEEVEYDLNHIVRSIKRTDTTFVTVNSDSISSKVHKITTLSYQRGGFDSSPFKELQHIPYYHLSYIYPHTENDTICYNLVLNCDYQLLKKELYSNGNKIGKLHAKYYPNKSKNRAFLKIVGEYTVEETNHQYRTTIHFDSTGKEQVQNNFLPFSIEQLASFYQRPKKFIFEFVDAKGYSYEMYNEVYYDLEKPLKIDVRFALAKDSLSRPTRVIEPDPRMNDFWKGSLYQNHKYIKDIEYFEIQPSKI